MPGIFRELENVRHQLENHYRDMQDIELLAFKEFLMRLACHCVLNSVVVLRCYKQIRAEVYNPARQAT